MLDVHLRQDSPSPNRWQQSSTPPPQLRQSQNPKKIAQLGTVKQASSDNKSKSTTKNGMNSG